jgi:hypothetical protein
MRVPYNIIKEPFVKTSSLILISPLKNWESYGLALTYGGDLDLVISVIIISDISMKSCQYFSQRKIDNFPVYLSY